MERLKNLAALAAVPIVVVVSILILPPLLRRAEWPEQKPRRAP